MRYRVRRGARRKAVAGWAATQESPVHRLRMVLWVNARRVENGEWKRMRRARRAERWALSCVGTREFVNGWIVGMGKRGLEIDVDGLEHVPRRSLVVVRGSKERYSPEVAFSLCVRFNSNQNNSS